MTYEEFDVSFEMIIPLFTTDQIQQNAIKAYRLGHFETIESIQEVHQLSAYLSNVSRLIKEDRADISAFIMLNPAFSLMIQIPINKLSEDLIDKVMTATDDFPRFLFEFFAERGVDFQELFGGDEDELLKFENIMQGVKLPDQEQ